MAKGLFQNICIGGMCVALPTHSYETRELVPELEEKALKRFIRATGVERRFLSGGGQTTSDLCYIAAKTLLNEKGINRKEIDGLIFISQNPDYRRPSTSIILQERLGLTKSCMAFDINLGCSGYVYGLYIAAGLICGGAVKKLLLLTGDVEYDIQDEFIFGDAGAATLIELGDGEIEGLMKSDGSGYQAIYTPQGGQRHPLNHDNPDWKEAAPQMDGEEVFGFTIEQVPQLLEEFKLEFKREFADYDYIILHQANLMMLKHIIAKLNIPKEKAPITIHKYGNASSASIPLGIVDLCMNLEHKEKDLTLLLSGFGVGLSLGAVSIQLSPEVVLPIVYSDYVWDEKFSEEY